MNVMRDLDDIKAIKKIDNQKVLLSLMSLHLQCEQAWQESSNIDYPTGFQEADNIVIAGMGGSSYGVRLVKSLYDHTPSSKVPISLSNNYHLPGYVNSRTLVILSSYGGATEETLECARQAKDKKAMITGITSGGPLEDFLKTNRYPCYFFNPLHNPSQQPRIGVGYMVMGLIGLLSRLSFIPVAREEVTKLVKFLSLQSVLYSADREAIRNPAKILARKLQNKVPIIVVADFLEGAGYAVQNPFHETAKQFAVCFTIPELNHHLLEGLTYPAIIRKLLHFIFITSEKYGQKNQKRLILTREIVKENSIITSGINLAGVTPLIQAMELVQFGAFVAYYLAVIHGVDPAKIPYVDYFKNKLSAIT